MTGCCGYLLPIVSVFISLFFSSVLSFQPIKLLSPLRRAWQLFCRNPAQDRYSTCYIFVVDFCCFTNVLLSGTQVRATVIEGLKFWKVLTTLWRIPTNEGTNHLLIKLHSLLKGWFAWQQSSTLLEKYRTSSKRHLCFSFLLKISYICTLVTLKPGLTLWGLLCWLRW